MKNVMQRLQSLKGDKIEPKDGNTPLHLAALWGNTECVRLLMQAGANSLIRNKAGQLPGQTMLVLDPVKKEQMLKLLQRW